MPQLPFGDASSQAGASKLTFGGGNAGMNGGLGGQSRDQANIEELDRAGRRMSLMRTYTPELLTSSPEGALAMAESNIDDDELLRSAAETTNYASLERLRDRMEDEDKSNQRAIWESLPSGISTALQDMGYQVPKAEEKGGRLFGSVPVLGEITEAALDWGEIPGIGGLVEEIQHGTGEVLEEARDVTSTALTPFTWLAEQPAHAYRAWKYQEDQGAGRWGFHHYLNPSEFSHAWGETHKDDQFVREENRSRASELVSNDPRLLRMATGIATGRTPDEVIESFGLDPDSPEAINLGMEFVQIQADPEFQDAVHELSIGQVSFGRSIANGFGFDDTDNGWGRVVSGTVDAGFAIASDPTLGLGRITKGMRFGRHAFRLETGGDIERMRKVTRVGLDLVRTRGGRPGPTRELVSNVADVIRPSDTRRARAVVSWSDRVAEGFANNELSRLMREVPSTATALGPMQDAHIARIAVGEKGLDTAEGVLEWLDSRNGFLEMAGTRLGGASPLTQGLRMPTLTATQRAALATKTQFTRAIDWGRVKYAPTLSEFTQAVGAPRDLTRQAGRFALSLTAGSAGRVLAGLTHHTPYEDVVRLYGREAVPEFQRLVNTGIFTGMDRATMDRFVDGFAQADLVGRSNMVEQFNEMLFKASGVTSHEAGRRFAERFVGRQRQAYATDGSDLVDIGGVESKGARLLDAQHADALAIPNTREFLRQARATNLMQFFNRGPSSFVDAKLGRIWKPAVLMRIGFIPRAAGEEVLRFVLQHGARPYLGAIGANWQVRETFGHSLRAQLSEAEDLGQVDQVNRLRQKLAETDAGLLSPLRSLAGAADRGFTRMWASQAESLSPWRQRMTNKAHALDERGVVSGLERMAGEVSLWGSGVMHRIAETAHIPSRARVGQWMAEHWNPQAQDAARTLIEDPRIARAFAENVAGSTMTPWETRRAIDASGAPVPKVAVSDVQGGHPVVMNVEMRPLGNEYKQFTADSIGDDLNGYYNSIYSRQHRLRSDRVANRVMSTVLPRWVGPWSDGLTSRLGVDDVATLRGDLNTLWRESDLLPVARRIVDRDDEVGEGLRVWFGQQVDEVAHAQGLNLDGRTLRATLEDDAVDAAAQRWMIYPNVDETRLIDDFVDLERKMTNSAKARLGRPDAQPRLREKRLYADERLAVPVQNGLSKIYTPLVDADPGVLDEAFVAAASRRILAIGGYGPDQADAIARNVLAGVDDATEAARLGPSGLRALSAWGSSDPRIADAVMGAADEVLGTRSTFGILQVPDEVMQVAAGDRAMGVRAPTAPGGWQGATDYLIDPYRLPHVTPTTQRRRFVQLRVDGEWYDDADLANATRAYQHQMPGTTRMYAPRVSDDVTRTWGTAPPASGGFDFVDVPDDIATRYGTDLDDELVEELGGKRLPSADVPEDGFWQVDNREVGEGLGEIEAMERFANSSMDEVLEVLTTLKRNELDDDVLHEVVEPLLRDDVEYIDDAGNVVKQPGYGFDHLVMGTKLDRLPRETYGPRLVASPDLRWDRFVREWFDGPVDKALSSVIRKPMFLNQFGQQLRNQRALADMFVDDDIAQAVRASGLDQDQLDHMALALRHGDSDEEIVDVVGDLDEELVERLSNNDLQALRRYGSQRNHGLDQVRMNALNRAMELTIPYIDDHRIRSAFQNYVGNFIPFQFAEEQFLKRWVRTAVQSPEAIRKGQLALNGIRNMGVIRTDPNGEEVFVYPLVGEAVQAISGMAAHMFGDQLRIPYAASMTGQVGYTLPGLGDRFGTPSVGPLVAMPLEVLSRHFPELAEFEGAVSGPGADRPVWSYFTPSWAGRMFETFFGDLDKGQLASATTQAMQAMAVNGQMPDENATDDERQEFIDRARSQARVILLARGLLGMVGPAAPAWETNADQLNSEFVELLRISNDSDTAVTAFLAKHPDAEVADLMNATAFTSESEFAGLGTPTDETFDWINDNESLVNGFPAAAPWLLPRAGADDEFSYRAWSQQVAKGLRRRKAPKEFLDDMYFQQAARDYFEARQINEAEMLTAVGPRRQMLEQDWRVWKDGYFAQHPVFERMLADPTKSQHRKEAIDQLNVLAASEDEGPVPDDLREMVHRYREYSLTIEALRGNRTRAVSDHRKAITTELSTWAQWYLQRHPHLRGFWMRIIEPELSQQDQDAAASSAA